MQMLTILSAIQAQQTRANKKLFSEPTAASSFANKLIKLKLKS